MDSRNYVNDYNFDWVEKMQKLSNRSTSNNTSQYPTSNQQDTPSSPAARQTNKVRTISIFFLKNLKLIFHIQTNQPDEETGPERARIIAASAPNVDVISDTKYFVLIVI